MQSRLHEEFEECFGKEVDQRTILHFLGLSDDEKSLATRAITSAFPSCKTKRVQVKGQSMYPFIDLLNVWFVH